MRYFNTYGPVNEQEHYVVSRSVLLTEIAAQVEVGHYSNPIRNAKYLQLNTTLQQVIHFGIHVGLL